jgi:adenosylhomocysteine nucleosidase
MKIGIIGAMDVEVRELRSKMTAERVTQRAGMTFWEGQIGEVPVVLVRSGVGKVSAGICVQILSDLFGVTHVLNTGVAGSLDSKIDIGDIVVSTTAAYHDVDATVFGYLYGEVPQLGTAAFQADKGLRAAAVKAVQEADPDIGVFEGQVVSGDQFIGRRDQKEQVLGHFPAALCTEMEGCAIAQAAYLNHLPFVIIRAISDKADESTTMAYDEFEGQAAIHCAKMVEYMLEHFTESAS